MLALVVVGGLVAAAAALLPAPGPARPSVATAVWKSMPPAGVAGRSEPSVVWTRKAMIVWGGEADNGLRGDGASFDLSAGTWTPLPPAPIEARRRHTAVWTGTRMLVYGGLGLRTDCMQICTLGDGAAYDTITKTWTPLAPAPLAARSGHTAVWLQNRMVVWGGAAEGGGALADGASYDPANDTWTLLPPAPLAPRLAHRTVATTHRMLVWGGSSEATGSGAAFADGAVYTPASNSWAAMAAAPGTLAARDSFVSVWTGKQMLLWGGAGRGDACAPCFQGDGAAYDPDTDTWTPMAPSPLSGRVGARAVWTGRDMLVWGGLDTAAQADGALYDPSGDAWVPLAPGPLPGRQLHAMVWTGQQLLVWGGLGAATLADGAVVTLSAF